MEENPTLEVTDMIAGVMHIFTQDLMYPVIVLLLLFAAFSVVMLGSIIVEAVTERRNFRVIMPAFIAKLEAAPNNGDDLIEIIRHVRLLNRQRRALCTLVYYMYLPSEALRMEARSLLAEEQYRYQRIVRLTDIASKVAPMLGLMGTLIPLGPGIVALGQGNTDVLSAALNVAFDTTVAGLVTAVICFIISRVRKEWYQQYVTALESAMRVLMEKAEDSSQPFTRTSLSIAAIRGKSAQSVPSAGAVSAQV